MRRRKFRRWVDFRVTEGIKPWEWDPIETAGLALETLIERGIVTPTMLKEEAA